MSEPTFTRDELAMFIDWFIVADGEGMVSVDDADLADRIAEVLGQASPVRYTRRETCPPDAALSDPSAPDGPTENID